MKRFAVPIVLSIMLVALLFGLKVVQPMLENAQEALRIEQQATPTPSPDVRSMMIITPDPYNTPAPTVMLIRQGVKGDEVRKLQQRLKELGYYPGECDGAFGPGTLESVKLFQSQHGLEADGIAGESTRAALYADSAQPYVPTPAPTAPGQ